MLSFLKTKVANNGSYEKINTDTDTNTNKQPHKPLIMSYGPGHTKRFYWKEHTYTPVTHVKMINGTIYDLKTHVLYYFICNTHIKPGKNRVELSINKFTDDKYMILRHSEHVNWKIGFKDARKWTIRMILKMEEDYKKIDFNTT